MNFFILREFPELPENFRILNYPRMRTSYEYIMRRVARDIFLLKILHTVISRTIRACALRTNIYNEGDGKEKGSRQQIENPIEICLKCSHHGKIALYLDRIH